MMMTIIQHIDDDDHKADRTRRLNGDNTCVKTHTMMMVMMVTQNPTRAHNDGDSGGQNTLSNGVDDR